MAGAAVRRAESFVMRPARSFRIAVITWRRSDCSLAVSGRCLTTWGKTSVASVAKRVSDSFSRPTGRQGKVSMNASIGSVCLACRLRCNSSRTSLLIARRQKFMRSAWNNPTTLECRSRRGCTSNSTFISNRYIGSSLAAGSNKPRGLWSFRPLVANSCGESSSWQRTRIWRFRDAPPLSDRCT